MKQPDNIKPLALVGMMGAGKTTLASLVAAKTGLKWFDLDALIEKRLGCTIAEVFQRYGESFFRQEEHAAFMELLETAGSRYVLATGGGTPIYAPNADLLLSQFFTVWLDAPPTVLYKRAFSPTRPLASQGPSVFFRLAKERHSQYDQVSQFRVDVSARDAKDLANDVMRRWKEMQNGG